MNELMLALLLWIGDNSEYAYDDSMMPPAVVQIERPELVERLFVNGLPATMDSQVLENLEASVAAIYDHEQNTIYAAKDIDLHSPEGQAVLLHELVHYLQFAHGVDQQVTCRQKLEYDAYSIQHDYMVEENLVPDFDKFTMVIRSLCPTDFY